MNPSDTEKQVPVTLSFEIVSAEDYKNVCRASRGFSCKEDDNLLRECNPKYRDNCVQVEFYSFCGKPVPGNETNWIVSDVHLRRKTGDTCQPWHKFKYNRISKDAEFARAVRPLTEKTCVLPPVAGGNTTWTHKIAYRPITKEVMSLTTSVENRNLHIEGTNSHEQSFAHQDMPFKGLRAGEDDCNLTAETPGFTAHSGFIKNKVLGEDGKPVMASDGKPERHPISEQHPGIPFSHQLTVCFENKQPKIYGRSVIDGKVNTEKGINGWVEHSGCEI